MSNLADNIAWVVKDGLDYWWANFKSSMGIIADEISAQSIALIQSTITACGLDTSGIWAIEFFDKLNFFFPVNETLVILNVLFVFWLGVFCLKVVFKLTPGVY